MSFSKILIANRAEIACRVIRTAHHMGYATVAVYSDADRNAVHVRQADEAVYIGASPATESYLSISQILQAAQHTGADAIHPGYGFLSENPAFAQACQDAKLTFIGPSAASMLAMGDKARAKRRMMAAGVPCAPGYLDEDQSDARLTQEAIAMGFPLLIKAVAGGGGRGMRVVRKPDEMQQALTSARREALSAFGGDVLMLERLIEKGRHIEVQIFADAHGNGVYLGERDCTAQRRRQKVIEEAPSAIVNDSLRRDMGRDAVAAALAVGYQGAGTVEFIVDQNLQHFFLEMNTRLQVEHPVTEMVTGLDLVEWQIRVARGEKLPLTQSEVQIKGHAIEVRLYTEDPYADFAPQTGKVLWWQPQAALQDGIRIDSGIVQGNEISPYYDPMVAKLIAWAPTRDEAIRKLQRALRTTPLVGLRNNASFLHALLDHGVFRQAAMTTSLLDEWLEQGHALYQSPPATDAIWCLAAAVLTLAKGSGWRPNSVAAVDLHLQCGNQVRSLRAALVGGQQVHISLDGQSQTMGVEALNNATQGVLRYLRGGVDRQCIYVLAGSRLYLAVDGATFMLEEVSAYPDANSRLDLRRAVAPVAGKVTQVLVANAATVQEGQQLVCMEAMKMEMWVSAGVAGQVLTVHAKVGDQIELGALLVELELPGDAAPLAASKEAL